MHGLSYAALSRPRWVEALSRPRWVENSVRRVVPYGARPSSRGANNNIREVPDNKEFENKRVSITFSDSFWRLLWNFFLRARSLIQFYPWQSRYGIVSFPKADSCQLHEMEWCQIGFLTNPVQASVRVTYR
jgi:hypothetical protein